MAETNEKLPELKVRSTFSMEDAELPSTEAATEQHTF